jgi:aspartyl aminopeptidase
MAASAAGLCEFIDASPSPFHVCATVARALGAAGYTELSEADAWPAAGKFFVVRAGSVVAWDSGGETGRPFRIVGAHTDSPNLRVKQHPDRVVAGWQVVALEPYGGVWLNSWLDRDLGISGRLSVRDDSTENGVAHLLVRVDDPILRVPQLAIHLAEDRRSLTLDPQRHLNAVWGAGDTSGFFVDYVAGQAGVDAGDVLGADLMTHDLAAAAVSGVDGEFVSAPRLDNQASCYAGLHALLAAEARRYLPVLALFDHEEVGSTSDHGAQSELLLTVLERIVLAAGGNREDFLRRLAGSTVASADMAHATHPNYPERHEPGHLIAVNGGPVLKVRSAAALRTSR